MLATQRGGRRRPLNTNLSEESWPTCRVTAQPSSASLNLSPLVAHHMPLGFSALLFRLAIIIQIEQTDVASGSSATRLTCVHRAYPHPLFFTMILTMSSKNASSSSNYLDLLELALLGQQHPTVTSPVSHASLHLEPRNASICPRLESDHCSAAHLSNKPHRNVQSGQHPGSLPPST